MQTRCAWKSGWLGVLPSAAAVGCQCNFHDPLFTWPQFCSRCRAFMVALWSPRLHAAGPGGLGGVQQIPQHAQHTQEAVPITQVLLQRFNVY